MSVIFGSRTNEIARGQNAAASNTGNDKWPFINTLAYTIVLFSAAVLIFLIVMASDHLADKDDSFKSIKDFIGILLPLIGTWMGTILAFYFSKQNFEAANQRVREMVNQITTTDEKLETFNVADVMIKPDTAILTLVDNEADFKAKKLSDLLEKMKESHSERMPILQKNTLKFIFLIYRTTIERFILGCINGTIKLNPTKQPQPEIANMTVDDMFQSDYSIIKEIINIKNCFQPLSATLSEIKKAMQDNAMCQDVFITKTGSQDEPVEGWVTNNLIIEKAELFKRAGAKS